VSFTSDTLEHDIVRISPEQVAVFNLCTDTTRHMNGIVTNMHPSEGVWLFRFGSFQASTRNPWTHTRTASETADQGG
jgi:hypothetical protein